MKLKTMLRVLLCFFIISSLIMSTSLVFAAGPSAGYFFGAGAGVSEKVIERLESSETKGENIFREGINLFDPIIHIQSLIMYMGIFIAVIIVSVYAIQWMLAAPARKQELKAGMWPLIIGVFLLTAGPKLTMTIYDAIKETSNTITDDVSNLGGTVISVIQTVGYLIAVIMMLIIAIQWMTSAPAKRQEIKGRMINLTIGSIILVAGTTLLGMIYAFALDVRDNRTYNNTTHTPNYGSEGGSRPLDDTRAEIVGEENPIQSSTSGYSSKDGEKTQDTSTGIVEEESTTPDYDSKNSGGRTPDFANVSM